MKKKLLAAAAALLLLAPNCISAAADWGYGYEYDYNDYGYTDYGYTDYGYTDYGTDNTWDNGQTWDTNGQTWYADESGTDSSADSSAESQPDGANNVPVNASFTLSGIVDKKFTADLKIDSLSKLTGIDLTITYDPAVLKLTSSTANKKAGGTGAAAELEAGTVQYQYTNQEGSEWKDSYLTLGFEILDPSVRSTVIYMTANSVLNEYATPLTVRADGTIVQIEGAVTFDAKDDESMYTELRVALSDTPVTLDSLGLTDAQSITFEDSGIASVDGSAKTLTTLKTGLSNMTVEFMDGTKKYYRLVVSESAPAPVTTAADTAAVPADSAAADGQQTAAPADPGTPGTPGTPANESGAAAVTAAAPAQNAEPAPVTKTETRSSSRMKYLIIYILVLVALIAILVEFFVFFGNPYAKSLAVLRQRKAEREKAAPEPDNGGGADGEPEENTYEDDAYEDYEEGTEDEVEYSDADDDGYEEYEDSSAVYDDPDVGSPDDSTGYDTADDGVYFEDGEVIVDDSDDEYEYEYDDEYEDIDEDEEGPEE